MLMGFDDRLSLFLLGCLIGSVVGYIVRLLQEMKAEIHEVDEKFDTINPPHDHDERGFLRYPVFANITLLVVLVLVVWASFASQKASNDVEEAQANLAETQKRVEHVTSCTKETLAQTVLALNERTTYAKAQAISNVELQKAQAKMLRILAHVPPYTDLKRAEAIQEYFAALDRFFVLAEKSAEKAEKNDYPTVASFEACLDTGSSESE
jgi:hypothetical protein